MFQRLHPDNELSQEEILAESMTFQVGMIASDGWVLASDTRAYDLWPVGRMTTAPVLSVTSKIENNAARSLIFAFSGGSTAVRAGILLNERASSITPESRREELTKIAFDSAPNGKPTGDSLIVIFYEAEPEIWTIPVGSAAVLRKDFAFGGGGNLAMYLVQRHYYSRSVEQLKFLAAHTVLEGHYFNPSVVDGLELWSSENGRASEASEEELAVLRKRSEKVHARLHKILTG